MATEFKSQICTTVEQSDRLLGLGLKPETADMHYLWAGYWHLSLEPWEHAVDDYPFDFYSEEEQEDWKLRHRPAWSLHRLMQMMPTPIKCRNSHDYADLYVNCELVQYRFYDTDYMHDVCYEHFNEGNVYDNVIDCIEWLIKEEHFPKAYLEV